MSRVEPLFSLHTGLPTASKLKPIEGLQVLRAIAVLLVTMFHARLALSAVAPRSLPDFGSYGVDIFFVISGFIMSWIVLRSRDMAQHPGWTTAWGFLKRRLIRIFPIYWLFAIAILTRLLHAHHRVDSSYLPAFFLLPPSHPPYLQLIVDFSWTMIFEMYFYYLFSLVLLVTVKHAVPGVIGLLILTVIVGSFIGIERPYLVVMCSPMLVEFVFGAVLALSYWKWGTRPKVGMVLTAIGIAGSFGLTFFPQIRCNGMQMIMSGTGLMLGVMTWGVTAALIVSGMVFWQPTLTSPLGKFAVMLGNASYSTYLASGLAMEFASRWLLVWSLPIQPLSLGEEALCETAIVFAVFFAGWVCYQFIEWPMVRKLQSAF